MKERIFRKEYATQLLKISRGDLDSAEGLASLSSGRKENVLFIAQQSVEKAIKAVLCAKGKPVPLSHDVLILLSKLDDSEQPPGGVHLSEFTPYATIRRYEEGAYELTQEDLRSALKIASDVYAWAKQEVGAENATF